MGHYVRSVIAGMLAPYSVRVSITFVMSVVAGSNMLLINSIKVTKVNPKLSFEEYEILLEVVSELGLFVRLREGSEYIEKDVDTMVII